MSQRNLSHANHPIGGFLISPLSRASVPKESTDANRSGAKCIPAKVKKKADHSDASAVLWVTNKMLKSPPMRSFDCPTFLTYKHFLKKSPDWP